MAPSLDHSSSTNSSLSVEQSVAIPRLFHLDLPRLKQTPQPLPEQADIASIHRVLDIASGAGEWAISIAQAAPQMQIIGIEGDVRLVEQARAQAKASGVNNATFTAMDPFGPLDLPDGTFDLVNARYIVGLLPTAQWPGVIQEFVRVSRPGGIIRLTETDMPITNSAAMEKLSGWIVQAFTVTKRCFSPSGRLLSITPMLKGLLSDADCQEVRQEVWLINFSAGMPFHAEVTQALAQTYQLVQPLLVSTGVATQEAVEQTYQQMLSEMQSQRFSATGLSLTVWGTKP